MIDFEVQGVELPNLDYDKVRDWLHDVAADYGFAIGALHYIFCNDDRILEVNRQFLQHDYYTDVITFDYTKDYVLSGDIFISLDTVCDNAKIAKVDIANELCRIIVHGLLHLTGQGDKTPKTKREMTRKENLALRKLSER